MSLGHETQFFKMPSIEACLAVKETIERESRDVVTCVVDATK